MKILIFHSDSETIDELACYLTDHSVTITKIAVKVRDLVLKTRPDLIILGHETLDPICEDIANQLGRSGIARNTIWILNSNPPSDLEIEHILLRLQTINKNKEHPGKCR